MLAPVVLLAVEANFARRGSFIALRLSIKNFPAALKVVKSTARPQGDTRGVTPVRLSTAASALLLKTGYWVGSESMVLIFASEFISVLLDILNRSRRCKEL